MTSLKILVTGATGYIGGSVLTTLLESDKKYVSNHLISALVRGEDKAKILAEKGVNPILFHSLDETDILQQVASEHDVVIHTASGFHTASAKALVTGLGERKKKTGKDVFYIHTSGTSNLGDQPITGKYHEQHIFSDKEDIYGYEKSREALQVYPQRTTDLVVVQTGVETGVRTTIIMSPTIYGLGSGLFNKLSIQMPIMIRAAIETGQAEVIGSGNGVWDYVHIDDLTTLYEIVLARIVAGEDVPHGPKGIIFSETGHFSWSEASQTIANALFTLGAIPTQQVREIDLPEAAQKWARGLLLNAELGFASNSRTSADVSRELGWKTHKTAQNFKTHFLEEAKLILTRDS